VIREQENHSRYIEVCANNACSKCNSTEPFVPGDCPFKILHLLSTGGTLNDGKLMIQPRRSGKTTEVIRHARMRSKIGEKVIIMVGRHQEKRRLERIIQAEAPGEDIVVMSAGSDTEVGSLCGRPSVSILGDDIDSTQLDRILKSTRPGAFKGGLTTQHG